jgi:broad specificity phosphatase PhoE
MTELFFIRHGSYIHDRVDEQGPRVDLGLSSAGRAEIEALRKRPGDFREIRTSLLRASTERRALESAAILAEPLGVPVVRDRDVQEWRSDDGTMDSDVFTTQWRSLTERQEPFHRFNDGCETGIELATRVHSALQTIALVTTAASSRSRFSFFRLRRGSVPARLPGRGQCAITRWRKEPKSERWVLESVNDTAHLKHPVA